MLSLRSRAIGAAIAVLGTASPALAQGAPSLATPTLERGALIQDVLARNPSVGAAQAAIREAQARVSQAGALEDPRLSYSVAPASLFSSVPDGHVVRLEQMLPFPGKRGLASDEAGAQVASANADAEQVRLELALEATRLYDAWFAVHRALAINQDHVALLTAFKDSATAEYTTGRASQQDPLQAEVELTHIEHMTVTLRADRDVLRARLNGLLHRSPDAPLPPPPDTLPLPDEEETDSAALIDRAEGQRPELTSLKAQAGGAQAALALAKRQAWPDFSVMGEYNSMWMDSAHQWMVGVGINIPLPWDKRAGETAEATARGQRIALETERRKDEIATEVATARLRLAEALHVTNLYRVRLLPASRDQVAAARAGFVAGKTPFNTLIDAERNLRDTELQAAESLADADTRRAELDRALGQLPFTASSGAAR